MLVLSPRFIGHDLDLDNIQFFIDYCNMVTLGVEPYTSGWMPTAKVFAASMDIEIAEKQDPLGPSQEPKFVLKNFAFSNESKTVIEKLFTAQGWVAFFTNKETLDAERVLLEPAAVDIYGKILESLDPNYQKDIFIFSTYRFVDKDSVPVKVTSILELLGVESPIAQGVENGTSV